MSVSLNSQGFSRLLKRHSSSSMTDLWVDPKTFGQTCRIYRDPQAGMVTLRQFREQRRQARLQQVIATDTVYVTCKFCGSKNVVKDGVRNGVQNYWCKACQRKFAGNQALPGMRFPPDRIATTLSLFYEGLSLQEIGRSVAQIYNDVQPSDSTIYEWVARFTQDAITMARGYRARAGTTWSADETVLDVAGGRTKIGAENTIWFWDVIDEDTRFLLASHLSWTRTTRDAEALFARAAQRATTPPKYIITDKLRTYIDGVERVFGADTVHVQSEGMASKTHINFIERFHGTLKQRTKVMRGMKNRHTAKLVLDGWLIHYNFFRPHESLAGKTPAEAAQIAFPYKNWKDVVMARLPQV